MFSDSVVGTRQPMKNKAAGLQIYPCLFISGCHLKGSCNIVSVQLLTFLFSDGENIIEQTGCILFKPHKHFSGGGRQEL